MNADYDDTPTLRQRLPVLVPALLIALAIVAIVVVGTIFVLPEWRVHDEIETQIAFNAAALTATAGAAQGEAEVLQVQAEGVQAELVERAQVFLTADQADSMLDQLYRYAQQGGVEITNLQLQPPAEEPTSDVYQSKTFRLQVSGTPRGLLDFMRHIKEAGAPGFTFANLLMESADAESTLTVDLIMFISPLASGDALAALPDPVVSTPTLAPTVFVLPSATPRPSATPTVELTTPTPTLLPATLTPTPEIEVMTPGTYNDDSPYLNYAQGNWIQIASFQGTNESYHYSADEDAEMTFVFLGTAVVIEYVAFSNFGAFEVYVDGVLWASVDSYAETAVFGKTVTIEGLPYGQHLVTVRSTGQRNVASSDIVIAIDAIVVPQAANPTPTPALESLPQR